MTQPRTAVGVGHARVEGRLKVTGQAHYAADQNIDGMLHAVIVDATTGRGRITGIESGAAQALPGVVAVISHLNATRLTYRDNPNSNHPPGERLRALQDDRVRFFGQPVAVAVATTLQQAQHAASLVTVTYDAEPPALGLGDGTPNASDDYARGNTTDALAASAVRMTMAYAPARTHHNPMEPHATVARWDGDNVTVWDKTQWINATQAELASVFDIPRAQVHVVNPYVGGAFGSALRPWPHVIIAALAARMTRRPVKLVLTRRQLYFGTGYRPAYDYRITLGADRRGRLTAMEHTIRAETSSYEDFREAVTAAGESLYSMPNVRIDYRSVALDVNTPIWKRGPGPATAAFAIEVALDELAHRVGVDPVDLRLRNEPEKDEGNGLPFSTRRLRECLATGAREIGWQRRARRPGTRRDGDWLIGLGMAAGNYHTGSAPAQARVRLNADGTAFVETASSDMGPGTYTSMTQVAADALGLTLDTVQVRLGDSLYPPTPPHGGSMTMASIGTAVLNGSDTVRRQAIDLAVKDRNSPLYGAAPDEIVVRDGRLTVRDQPGRADSYRRLLARNNRDFLEAVGSYTPNDAGQRFSMSAYAATFAEVAVDATLGLIRIRKLVGVYDAGRIVNPRLAESQAIGGMVGGIGAALLEHTVTDGRDGRIVNANLADYLVPVNADVPELKAVYLRGEDPHMVSLGVKGLGEVVHVGVAPAIANAVFNATGRRVRSLPITVEALQ
jgi:xanthine dehydrogenase YagR molybdenum-binding subunit